MEASFYVTLPSNSSMKIHPDNTLAHFFVTLPSPLTLSGEWEVAMAEFVYPHRWLNVIQGDNLMLCTAGTRGSHGHSVPEGYYSTPEDILSSFRPPLSHDGEVTLTFNKHIQKIRSEVTQGARLSIFGRLATLLGFEDGCNLTGINLAPRTVDVHPFHSLFVYTNIIQYSTVGDVRAPLLRIVNVEGNYGDIVAKIYDNPHYVPLKQKMIDTIEIDIRDDTGESIPFINGRVIIKLHFRQQRSPYFN